MLGVFGCANTSGKTQAPLIYILTSLFVLSIWRPIAQYAKLNSREHVAYLPGYVTKKKGVFHIL